MPTRYKIATQDRAETFTNKTLTSPILTTPDLWTPSWWNLINCTWIPWSSNWTLVPWTPTRTANTTFTVTDTSNANKYDLLLSRWTIITWKESTVVKTAIIDSASYSTNIVTVTITWNNPMASIDASSLKYFSQKCPLISFAYPLTCAVWTDVTAHFYADKPYTVMAAQQFLDTAWTTWTQTIDINKNDTTMFATKPPIASTATIWTFTWSDAAQTLAIGDKVSIDIDAKHTTAWVWMYVNLYIFPTNNLYL